jgi:exportin-T
VWSNSSGLQYKKERKASTDPIAPARREFLVSLLSVVLEKLKWEESDDPDDMDEDDKAAFEVLRKVDHCLSYLL